MSESDDPKGRRTRDEDRAPEPIVRTATEARQGEIILGPKGRMIWIGSFILMAVLILVLGLWW